MSFSLLCLPFAGSGAGFFRAWPRRSAGGTRIVPVQMPGREERFLEDPHTDALEAAKEIAQSAPRLVDDGESFALFGHSVGAVLAYETARELEAQGGVPGLRHLFVSGSPGPWSGRTERATDLADDAFVERVAEFAGYRHSALDDPDLRDVLLPLLRADVELHENYRPGSREPLTVPVTALRGADDTLVGRAQCEEWAATTTGSFDVVELPGGHMYLTEDEQSLLDALDAVLTARRS